MKSVRQYLFSIYNSRGLTRTLGQIHVCRDAQGRICYTAGNSAVVFKILRNGEYFALRCYLRKGRNLSAIYGERLLRDELFVFKDPLHGEWVDVVLDRWIEGATLHDRITLADQAEFIRLAASFDRLAAAMTADDQAHGDLKPENIVVQSDGTMRLIDYDASFVPAFAGAESPELGTAAYQHPARTAADFDARLDDYPAALISTALHALALDPSLRERYGTQDTLLVDPHRISSDDAFREILALFERQGMAVQYRIARLLLSPTLRLHGLSELFAYAVQTPAPATGAVPELYTDHGLWGFRDAESKSVAIPPLYDCGFDFSEGLAAVQLGGTWHFIDPEGRTAIRCPGFDAVKPFRGGKAQARRGERLFEINRTGRTDELEY